MPSRAEQFIKAAPQQCLELTLPSERTVLVRRPPLVAWAAAGTIPPPFSKDVKEAWSRLQGESVDSFDDLPEEKQQDAMKVLRGLTVWAFVDPTLREGGTGEDGTVDPSFLTLDDWNFMAKWIMGGSPGIPIETKTGEAITVEAVRSFRDGERGPEPVSPGNDGGEVRAEALGTAGAE